MKHLLIYSHILRVDFIDLRLIDFEMKIHPVYPDIQRRHGGPMMMLQYRLDMVDG